MKRTETPQKKRVTERKPLELLPREEALRTKHPPKPERTPIPFDDALRRILNAPPQPRKAKPKKTQPKSAGK